MARMTEVRILLFCLVAAVFGLASSQDCADFTVGNCQFNQDDAYSTFDLPGEEDDFPTCQELCQIEEQCNYFLYDSSAGECLLFTTFNVDSCTTVTGTQEPDVFECIPEPGSHTCDDIIQVDCDFLGDIVLEEDQVFFAAECQALLETLGDTLGATYFIFDTTLETCFLLTSSERECQSVTGPDFPDYETDCASSSSDSTTQLPTDTTTVTAGGKTLVAGLGYSTSFGYRTDLQTFQLEPEAALCDNLGNYPINGQTGPVSAVLDGVLHVCGGFDGAVYNADCFRYQAGIWTRIPYLLFEMDFAGSSIDGDGNWIVTGGAFDVSSYWTHTQIFTEGQWTEGPELPRGRVRHCQATFDGGRKILVAGGDIQDGEGYSSSALVYDRDDPDAGWRPVADMNVGRSYVPCVEVGGRIMVAGGSLSATEDSDSVEFYDPASDTWEQGEPMPLQVGGHKLAKLSDTQVVLTGGYDEELSDYVEGVFLYDAATEEWSLFDGIQVSARSGLILEFLPEDEVVPTC